MKSITARSCQLGWVSYRSKFIELAAFIGQDDLFAYYTFFGTTLKTKALDENWKLSTNWFGEITYVAPQPSTSGLFIYTSGICLFLHHNFSWGSIGFPLCIGLAYSQGTFSMNTRAILNLSLNLQ